MNHNKIASNRKTDLPVFSGLDKRPSENGDKWIGIYLAGRVLFIEAGFI
jgi:hypothetical protein